MTSAISDPIVPIICDIAARLIAANGNQTDPFENACLAFEVAVGLTRLHPEYVAALAQLAKPFTPDETAIIDAWIASNPVGVRDDE